MSIEFVCETWLCIRFLCIAREGGMRWCAKHNSHTRTHHAEPLTDVRIYPSHSEGTPSNFRRNKMNVGRPAVTRENAESAGKRLSFFAVSARKSTSIFRAFSPVSWPLKMETKKIGFTRKMSYHWSYGTAAFVYRFLGCLNIWNPVFLHAFAFRSVARRSFPYHPIIKNWCMNSVPFYGTWHPFRDKLSSIFVQIPTDEYIRPTTSTHRARHSLLLEQHTTAPEYGVNLERFSFRSVQMFVLSKWWSIFTWLHLCAYRSSERQMTASQECTPIENGCFFSTETGKRRPTEEKTSHLHRKRRKKKLIK